MPSQDCRVTGFDLNFYRIFRNYKVLPSYLPFDEQQRPHRAEEPMKANQEALLSINSVRAGEDVHSTTRRRDEFAGLKRLWLYCSVVFNNGLFISLRGSIIGDMAASLGVASNEMASFFLLCGIGGMVAAFPAGIIVNNLSNPHRCLSAGLFLRAAACAGMAFVRSLDWACALGFVLGMTMPLTGVPLRTAIVRSNRQSSGGALNLVMGAFGLGSILAPMSYLAMEDIVGQLHGSNATDVVNTTEHGTMQTNPAITALELLWFVSAAVALVIAIFGCVAPPPPQAEPPQPSTQPEQEQPAIDTDCPTGCRPLEASEVIPSDGSADAVDAVDRATECSTTTDTNTEETTEETWEASPARQRSASRLAVHTPTSPACSSCRRCCSVVLTDCRDWRVFLPLAFFIGMSVRSACVRARVRASVTATFDGLGQGQGKGSGHGHF